MKFRKIMSIVLGVGAIGLLSSVFAVLQGKLFPQANEMFSHPLSSAPEVTQVFVKLACIYISCMIGGVVTTSISGNLKEGLIVGLLVMIIIGWLWYNAIYPIWFWPLLIAGVVPFVIIGYKIRRSFISNK